MDSSRNLVVQALNGIEELRGVVAIWRDLAAAAPIDPLFNSPDWSLLQAAAYANPKEVFGWKLSTPDGLPVALLPFRLKPRTGPLDLDRAILIADGTFDSDYLDLPIRPGFEAAAIEACVDLLSGCRGIDAVVLASVPSDSKTPGLVRIALERRGLERREIEIRCAVVELPPTFEAYVAMLKPRMRSKVRSALRAASERKATVQWCDDVATIDRELDGLFLLHTQRWNAAGEKGSFASDKRRRFYAVMARDLAAKKQLRFARLDLDGRAVAYQIGAVARDAYYQIQEGYDPTLSDLRVGTMLRGLVLQTLIQEGIRRYDFMAGVSQHKQDWGAEIRMCTSIGFPLPKFKGQLAFKAQRWVEALRGARK